MIKVQNWLFDVFLLVKWLCDWICEVLGLLPVMQGCRRMPRNEVCGEWYVCDVVCYMSLIHLHLWRPVLADLWSRLMPCASINWQLVKRAEALLVPHAYAQLCRIRIAFWIANDNCECLLIVVCCWEAVKFIMLLSNILIIIILFILFDFSPPLFVSPFPLYW